MHKRVLDHHQFVMALIRVVLVLFIGFGLILTPVRSANAKCSNMPDVENLNGTVEPATDHDCPCCNPGSQCPKANCLNDCMLLSFLGFPVTAAVWDHSRAVNRIFR